MKKIIKLNKLIIKTEVKSSAFEVKQFKLFLVFLIQLSLIKMMMNNEKAVVNRDCTYFFMVCLMMLVYVLVSYQVIGYKDYS